MTLSLLLPKQAYVAVELESTYGTEPTWAAEDFIQVFDLNVEPVTKSEKLEINQASLSQGASLMTSISHKATFKAPLWAPNEGTGVATTPRYFDLLTACAMAVTEDATGGAELTHAIPNSPTPLDDDTAVSIKFMETDTLASWLESCYGNVKIVLEAGKIPHLEFEFFGKYHDPESYSGESLPTWTLETRNDHAWRNVDFDLRYQDTAVFSDLVIQKVEVDLGNQVSERDNAAAEFATEGPIITSRVPTATVVFEKDPTVANAATKAAIDGDTVQFRVAFGDPSAASAIATARGQLLMPSGYTASGDPPNSGGKIVGVKDGEANGVVTTELSLELFGSDNELKLITLRDAT